MSLGLKKRPPWALVVMCSLVGFLLVITGTATSAAKVSQEPRKKELIDQIVQQRSNVEDLDQAVAQLRGQVEDAQQIAGQASTATAAAKRRAGKARPFRPALLR